MAPAAAPRRVPAAMNAAGAGSAAPAALRGRPFAIYEAAFAPPPARTTAAALRELLKRVADAMLLGFCGVSWVNLAANGVAIAARWACGEDSRAGAVANKVAFAAFVAMGVLFPVAGPRLLRIIEGTLEAGGRQSRSGATRRANVQLGRLASTGGGAGARLCPNGNPVMLALVVVYLCLSTKIVPQLIQVFAPAKRYNQEKSGVSFSDMASLIGILLLCFFLLPDATIKLRRMM